MGPTGLLCMRETTRGRRRDGMLVGLGATLSDLVYGLIAYWGVGIVLNLLDQYSSSLRLGGSIFILGFCIILLTRHVSTSEDDTPAPPHRLKSAYSVNEGIWSLCPYALQPLHHPPLPPTCTHDSSSYEL